MEIRPTARDTEFFVSSESGEREYQLVCVNGQWKCTCRDYLKNKVPCKHIGRLMEYLQERDGAVEPEESDHDDHMVVPQPSSDISRWIKKIHGKDFIQYEGLLAMAHEQGLIELHADFISVTAELALAYAWAAFKDGKKFQEAADATPQNVHAQVKSHFPRVALTRAKARTLRDALNIGTVAVEELDVTE